MQFFSASEDSEHLSENYNSDKKKHVTKANHRVLSPGLPQGAPKGPLVPPRGPEGAPESPRAPWGDPWDPWALRRCAPAVQENTEPLNTSEQTSGLPCSIAYRVRACEAPSELGQKPILGTLISTLRYFEP